MLQAELERFRAVRSRTLALINGLAQAQMDYAPAAGKWSVGEVADHLLLAERLYRSEIAQLIALRLAGREPALDRSFADINVSLAFVPKALLPFLELPLTVMNFFVPRGVRELMMRYRIAPAVNPDAAAPRPGRDADELRAELLASLRETETLLSARPELDYRAMIVRRPLLGTNNVPQLLRLMALHEERHQTQIDGLLADRRFPWPRDRDRAFT
jgi:uncharacterized damage-inducible protein DinB